ncbi:MAG: hypothetical protein OQJ89_11760 [Kangiellaceae bacterium]|nr:hypothetical protein [Kangiellaceae bacterium]MCW9017635.1 hypothetical protein [Kangiellaceae bacterium]
MELYKLEVITDNPKFEGFGVEDFDEPSRIGRECFDDDISPAFERGEYERLWNPTRLTDCWVPPKVAGEVKPYNDFPGLDLLYPAFSKRAVTVLKDLLEPNGEILPLDSDKGEYFFYNITSIQDALDLEHSKCDFWCDPPTTAVDIDYFAFDKQRLKNLPIFRIIEKSIFTIVSDEFVNRVKENKLNGFVFRKIWPLEKGEYWRDKAHEITFPENHMKYKPESSGTFMA